MKRPGLSVVLLFLVSPFVLANDSPKSSSKATAAADARKGVAELNQREIETCQKMDHAANSALWADEGVDLIQGLQPMIGKEAISKWYDSLSPQLRVQK